MYYLLTESFKSQEKRLVALIAAAIPVEKIYLIGSCLEQKRTESIFVTTAPSARNVGHYYLLLLIDTKKHTENYVQDVAENVCRSFIPVTAIVLHLAKFNKWLGEGHRFACTVVKTAVRIYERVETPLAIPKALPEATCQVTDDDHYAEAVNKVNEFIAGAELFMVRLQNKMAAFMLHQAAEHALHAIFKKATGLHINTHNIDKLIRYCSMLCHSIPAVFQGETDQQLLRLLQQAYIDTRYKHDFTISNKELAILMDRVKAIEKIM